VWVEKLDISGWRNHSHSALSFSRGTTLLVGPNGQGKTNIVEALYYLGTLASHRVSSSAALIGDGYASATIYAELRHDARTVSVGLTLKRKGSTDAVINGAKSKTADIPYWVSVVMFAPEDIAIIRGEPSTRRAFMDQLVISASPSTSGVYQDFERVLKQRNSLLKSLKASRGRADMSTLDVWNEKFAALSAAITLHRVHYLTTVMPLVTEHYSSLANNDAVAYRYLPSAPLTEGDLHDGDVQVIGDKILETVKARSQEEIDRGQTLVGPQRDDIEFTISSKPARTHASQGETWSLALSLRLATAAWLRHERSSGDPIIVLDDVFAELDSQRRGRLLGLVADYEQLIVTAAVEEDLPQDLIGVVYDVRNGEVLLR
jgi:DNA replication and repair protein RecF